MTKQLQDKIAIVTGASNGIGRGIAEMFGAEGAKTVLVARRAELLDEVAAGIKAKGGEALPVPTDLTKEDALVALFAKVKKTYGRLDVLVNNAGIATHQNTEDITLDYWQDALDINITAAFLCTREAIRIMKEQTPQGGRIINMGSISAKTPRPDSLPYTATKFGLQGMTHQLTMDGRKHGIVASIIHPGATLSLVHDAARPHEIRPRRQARGLRHGAAGRRQGRGADGVAAGRGESVRGDDPAEPHAELHRAGMILGCCANRGIRSGHAVGAQTAVVCFRSAIAAVCRPRNIQPTSQRENLMRISSGFRAALIALTALRASAFRRPRRPTTAPFASPCSRPAG